MTQGISLDTPNSKKCWAVRKARKSSKSRRAGEQESAFDYQTGSIDRAGMRRGPVQEKRDGFKEARRREDKTHLPTPPFHLVVSLVVVVV